MSPTQEERGAVRPVRLKRAKGVRRVERPSDYEGWVARRVDGSFIPDARWRWNTRSAAWHAAYEADCLATPSTNAPTGDQPHGGGL